VLVLVTIGLYVPATGHSFVSYDDKEYVLDNTHVTSGLSLENARWAFRSGYAANWHPVTWLSHMLDCQLFGLNPWGHHLTNVLLHALNAGLVFALLQQMTGAVWRSLFVAALFAVHPLRVESVAWVAERKDVLSGFFGLLSLIAYAGYAQSTGIRSQESQSRGRRVFSAPGRPALDYGLAVFLFALGLMSKPMLVTWPFVMLLLDYWPLQRFKGKSTWPLVAEKIPFFALAALACVTTFWVQQHEGAVNTVQNLPLGTRSGNALVSYCRYLEKLFWPADLAVFYPHPGHWSLAKVLLAGGVMLAVSVVVFEERRRFPFLLVGWLWFIGTLVPVIGLVQVGDQAMADRYTYLPSLGLLILAIWGAYELTRGWHYPVFALAGAGSAALVLCIVFTRQQLGHWEGTEALFRHALQVTENNYVAHVGLGIELVRKDHIDEAISQYQEGLRLKPDYALAHNNLGYALLRKGQIEEAISHYHEALFLKPDYTLAHHNLGNALLMKGQIDEAISQYQAAILLKPDYADAHNDLGLALYRKGRPGEAMCQFQEALRLDPDHSAARKNLDFVPATKTNSQHHPTPPANP
jgi:Tfp pilus assembly protein PilF